MGRHNTVAGRMAASAASRGRLFTKLARLIMVAARSGADLNANPALRSAVLKARDYSMPKENIERAIKKGAGELDGQNFEEALYEGYGPAGSAILVEVLTDNKNRTHPELRKIFQRHSGSLGEVGSVAWMFERQGVLIVEKGALTEDALMEKALDAGAQDILSEEECYLTIFTSPSELMQVREALTQLELKFEKCALEFLPTNRIDLQEENKALAEQLVEALEDHDDVQNVFYNF